MRLHGVDAIGFDLETPKISEMIPPSGECPPQP